MEAGTTRAWGRGCVWGCAASWLHVPRAVAVRSHHGELRSGNPLHVSPWQKHSVLSFLWAFQALLGFSRGVPRSACTFLRFSTHV